MPIGHTTASRWIALFAKERGKISDANNMAEPLKGAKGENLKVEVEKNALPFDRKEIITVRFSDKESGEITILQDAKKE